MCFLVRLDLCVVFFFQAEDGIRDLVRSRGLGDVYKRQNYYGFLIFAPFFMVLALIFIPYFLFPEFPAMPFSFAIVLFSLPSALKLWQKALNRKQPKNPLDFIVLDGATAQYNLIFGLLCTGALVIESLFRNFF